MKKKYWLWIILGALLCITILVCVQQLTSSLSTPGPLTSKAAKELVQNRYQGTVTQIQLSNDRYIIKMKKDNSMYNIKLDANTGEILSMSNSENSGQTSAQEVTESEVKRIISEKTKGTILSIAKVTENGKQIYKVIVKESNIQTLYTVDAVTGTILTISTNERVETAKKLTEAEASQLALKQVSGLVDEVLFETGDGQSYYLVKIKTKDETEATVQVHAISGKIMSISWDKDSNHDSNDD
ncbi:PepSY domain-containing protein [Bacillus sp. USDA818B3_A]|uniref:PepSY domain-containing protein n=1 Tax=Bacillus sp. USDA818B3_A TaxID=2698834 RepID=UPI00136EA432|nr:PepSY domain-containing protein [Bacillus sp. USDA818B3_A]